MKQAQSKTRIVYGRKRKHLATSETPMLAQAKHPTESETAFKHREAAVDAYWEAHPELTRKQAERKVKK